MRFIQGQRQGAELPKRQDSDFHYRRVPLVKDNLCEVKHTHKDTHTAIPGGNILQYTELMRFIQGQPPAAQEAIGRTSIQTRCTITNGSNSTLIFEHVG